MIKVLIADDQTLIRDSIKIILEAAGKFEVTGTAANGKEVLEMIKQNEPDVILMDRDRLHQVRQAAPPGNQGHYPDHF